MRAVNLIERLLGRRGVAYEEVTPAAESHLLTMAPGALSRAASSAVPGYPQWLLNRPFELPDEALQFPMAYRLVPIVYACVNQIQNSIASLPMRFYVGDGPTRVKLEREPGNIVDVWTLANDTDTGRELILQIIGSLMLNGNGYLFKEMVPGSPLIRGFYALPGQYVRPIPGPRRTIKAYRWTYGGEETDIPSELVVQFKMYDPDHGPVGLSPLQVAQLQYQTQRNAARWQNEFFKRGGVVPGQYASDMPVGIDEIERIKNDIRRGLQSPEGAFNPFILTRGLKFVRAGLTQQEMQFLETYKLTDAQIFAIFHIPPVVMGVKEHTGLSDAGAMTDLMLFWENCIKPIISLVEAVLNERLLSDPQFGGTLSCAFDLTNVLPLQEVWLKQAKQLSELTGGPVLLREEARDRLGLERLDDPEVKKLLVPFNMTVSGEAPPPPAVPPKGAQVDAPAKVLRAAHELMDRLMMRNISREKQRRINNAKLARWERMTLRTWRSIFTRQEANVVEALNAEAAKQQMRLIVDAQDLLKDQELDQRDVRKLLSLIVKGSGDEALAELGLELAFQMNNAVVRKFLDEKSGHAITEINGTTRERLMDELGDGLSKGESLGDLVARVRGVFRDRRANAQTIARTETAGAMNFGMLEGWKQSEIVEEKEWLTAQDDAVRETHAQTEADGPIPIDQPFRVGSDFLDFPGDPSGSAGEVINCRCTLLPVVSNSRAKKPLLIPARLPDEMSLAEVLS